MAVHDVRVHKDPSPDDEGKGMSAIIRSMLNNPVATIQMFGVIGAGFALYYANSNAIADAKAQGQAQYVELTASIARNNERIVAKLEGSTASDAAQTARIESIFQRGDVRWATVQAKLNENDVKFARVESSINYLVRILDKNSGGLVPEIGPLPSK